MSAAMNSVRRSCYQLAWLLLLFSCSKYQFCNIVSCPGYLAYLFQNQEVNSHTGNLITICLMYGWRSKGASSAAIVTFLERIFQVATTGMRWRHRLPVWSPTAGPSAEPRDAALPRLGS